MRLSSSACILGFALLLCSVFLASCKPEEIEDLDAELSSALSLASNGNGNSFFQFPASDDFSKIPQDPLNPLSREKVELGKLLYHETALALDPEKVIGTGTYSCASCHHAAAGFQAGVAQGISEGGIGFGINGEGRTKNPQYDDSELDIQPLRTPSALNIAYQECILWNGQFGATGLNDGTQANWTPGTPKEVNNLGYQGTETQAIAGLKVHRMEIDSAFLSNDPIYSGLFDYVFYNWPADKKFSNETAGLAIAAYERTLYASEAPFQQWLKGQSSAMDESQKRGAILFFGKAECYSCHNGPALNSMAFYALGMKDLEGIGVYGFGPATADKKGRGGFTGDAADDYTFKVPQLYNLKDSPFYGHGSSFTSVEEVVRYKNKAIPENQGVPSSNLSSQFRPLNLTDSEVDEIVDFIDHALYDPKLERYVPGGLPSGNCFPNNDPMSIVDLDCL